MPLCDCDVEKNVEAAGLQQSVIMTLLVDKFPIASCQVTVQEFISRRNVITHSGPILLLRPI